MTEDEFRTLALSLPETAESAHMDHPDFRVGGKIFATIGPGGDWAMVKLTPEQQAAWLARAPGVFRPASGAWGQRGATLITLREASEGAARVALGQAWRNTAPKAVQRRYPDEPQ